MGAAEFICIGVAIALTIACFLLERDWQRRQRRALEASRRASQALAEFLIQTGVQK